ncbi:PREDICTED: cysteine-rich receptor-like protein kinase 10 [Ipomoea nil]|uniref:cysteine-rich receptor-like protein kinase 10 n=1 Tax=Ipomoea nil TaxID=35883 RepID=UPI000901AF21|nr:PREDICTED: cysteine-rich receptor-like protein kinase 10 [Ipomoea nil]
MDSQEWIIFILLSLHLCSATIAADNIDPNYEWHQCGTSGNYTPNSTYDNNLNTLLSSLSNNVNQYGFYNGSVGQDSERASAIVLCRGDIELSVCRGCVKDNAERIKQLCPNQREAFRWYNICSIYYSHESILGSLRITPEIEQHSITPVKNPGQFNQDLTSLVDRLRRQAVNGGPFLKYAANSTAGPDSQTIYAYVQCTPDLSVRDCENCLKSAFALWNKSKGNGMIGARVLRPSCFFRYEISPFFGASLINGSHSAPQPLPPPLASPSPASSPPPPPQSGKDGNKASRVTIAASIAAGLVLGVII